MGVGLVSIGVCPLSARPGGGYGLETITLAVRWALSELGKGRLNVKQEDWGAGEGPRRREEDC